MKIDMYTKAVLTVIAAGLIALVAQNGLKPAYALGDGCGTAGDPCYIDYFTLSGRGLPVVVK